VETPGARSLIIQIPDGWKHRSFPVRTSDSAFHAANAGRVSDLSVKRNLGLLLSRLHGWNKVVFLDDDVEPSHTGNIHYLARQLDVHQVVGMTVHQHPDNSVVCHARRLAGLSQGVFITGAALGVHCNSLPLAYFPDIYNEDWFFFAREAAARELPRVGEAKQAPYDPFKSPLRARHEEFGDLLAEGLYALIGQASPGLPFCMLLHRANLRYWSEFRDARHEVITEAKHKLNESVSRDEMSDQTSSALAALAAAESQLQTITPDLCVSFIDAWQQDLYEWQTFSTSVSNVGSTRIAMDFLELKIWVYADSALA
jgi:hypothetical protein